MKKYWRCFVCNDIHYGVKPPEICPTCKVGKAYVEVSPDEFLKIAGAEKGSFSKEKFLQVIEEFTEGNEFRVNSDREKVEMLLEGIFANERNHGLKYCPCRLIAKDPAEDLKLVCPCNFLVHETYKDRDQGECWCGLFARR